MKVNINQDGQIAALYEDAVKDVFNNIGTYTIERWSNVEYDNRSGKWAVMMMPDMNVIFESTSRQKCLLFEAKMFSLKGNTK